MRKTIIIILAAMLISLVSPMLMAEEASKTINIKAAKFEDNKIEIEVDSTEPYLSLELDYKKDTDKWLSEDFDNLITLTYNEKTCKYEHKFKDDIKFSQSFEIRLRPIVNAVKGDFSNVIVFKHTLNAKNYDAWAVDYIHKADSLGLVTESMREDMKAATSRLEFVEALIKAVEYKNTIKDYDNEVVSDTSSIAVKKAYKLKLLTYNESKTFGPDRKITREEVAVILDKLASVIKFEDKFENKLTYNDASEWALASIDSVVKKGLLLGDNKQRFNPKKNMTRQEVLVTVLRLI
ncbi:S-layer homology domain-containing protein [Fenollaria timonensis]|uniref:S-layer homology domain-containing protein n=1 Tax=Fenollaria timonensis TaxID=1723384 RepID=UPI00071DBB03|nr:S-layer homology domain-containing protein [Fenollaria timonensis]